MPHNGLKLYLYIPTLSMQADKALASLHRFA